MAVQITAAVSGVTATVRSTQATATVHHCRSTAGLAAAVVQRLGGDLDRHGGVAALAFDMLLCASQLWSRRCGAAVPSDGRWIMRTSEILLSWKNSGGLSFCVRSGHLRYLGSA